MKRARKATKRRGTVGGTEGKGKTHKENERRKERDERSGTECNGVDRKRVERTGKDWKAMDKERERVIKSKKGIGQK